MNGLKIVEELQDIDKRLIECLTNERLSNEEREALIEARADLAKAASRMLVAKILDPEDYRKFSEAAMQEIRKAIKSG